MERSLLWKLRRTKGGPNIPFLLNMKTCYIKTVAKGFFGYVKASVQRWFSPRVYLVSVTYEEDKTGKLVHESKLMSMWTIDIHALTSFISTRVGSGTVHIDSVVELIGVSTTVPEFDPVQQIVDKAEKIVEEIKKENSPASSLQSQENGTASDDDDEEISVDSFIQNK